VRLIWPGKVIIIRFSFRQFSAGPA